MAISTSLPVTLAGVLFGLIGIGFGIFDLIDPEGGLTFFEFEPSIVPSTRAQVNSLITIIGVRDIFLGIAILSTLYTGNRGLCGLYLISFSACAAWDGYVCFQHGKGEWNHWGYAPMLTIVGALLMGVADSKEKVKRR